MKHQRQHQSALLLSAICASTLTGPSVAATPAIDADDIGGVVRSEKGPEAGVWVIAETNELPTKMAKIVVTDDEGRYVIPDLPKAKYRVWVRGYGLVDSAPVETTPGSALDLKAAVAPTPQAAAQYYPSNYWFSLLEIPSADEFPGTGPSGNGILPSQRTQQHWIANMTEGCTFCHQIGTKIVRELPKTEGADSMQLWARRIVMVGQQHPPIQGGDIERYKTMFTSSMSANIGGLGRNRALKMFADWSDKIAAGAVPEAPPRPQGIERNAVITLWDWAGGQFVHDMISTDKRNPTINSYGPVVGVNNLGGLFVTLDPKTATAELHPVPDLENPNAHDEKSWVHTNTMDHKGRSWSSAQGPGPAAEFCVDESANPFAAYFPRNLPGAQYVAYYDPKGNPKIRRVQVCFGSHHLNFASDKDNTLYFSGDTDVVGWVKTNTWDETQDWKKSIGWCPFVLDTNGDGKITPDRTQWNEPGQPIDPKKDTRITGFPYGMGVAPNDGAVWFAKYTPYVPSGIIRVEVGDNPPLTCKTEYYEPPQQNGLYSAFNARGVDVDSRGIAWVAFGSGHIGRFDRNACKVKNGPAATGQHCPEGWKIYRFPGPALKSATTNTGSTSWHYLTFVDHHNGSGLGKDIPLFPASTSDSIVAFLPDSEKFVELRIPYPLSAYPRGLDVRIDDPKAGWKGRGIWSSYNTATLHHVEGGVGTYSKVFQIQVRPDPLAH